MWKSGIVSLVVAVTISLVLLASTTSAVAASLRTTPSIGKQVAKLKGSDTVPEDIFDCSAAISSRTIIVGAPGHAKNAGRASVFEP